MAQSAEASPFGLEYYGLVLKRHWLVVVAGVALGGLAAVGFLALTPQTSTATADVNINIISTDPFNVTKQASSLLDGTTETQIATSYSVAADAAKALKTGLTANDVRRNLTVVAVTGASVVHISFTAPTKAAARAGANAVAVSYLNYRTTQAQSKLDSILKGVETRRTQLGAELVDANSRISSNPPGSTAANQAVSDRDLVTIELNALLAQKSGLAQIDPQGGSVLTTASENEVTVKPSSMQVLGAGVLAGGVLGLIAAFVISPFTRRMRTAHEVARAAQAPVLADIRSRKATVPETGDSLEALRTARERILTELPSEARLITILDDTSGLYPSDVPANLALVLAQSGVTTQLIVPRPSTAGEHSLRDSLHLAAAPRSAAGTVCDSSISPHLQVFFPAPASTDTDADAFVPGAIRDHVVASQSGDLHLLVLDRSAPRSSLLAALRLSDAVIVVAELRHSRADDLAGVAAEAAQLGTRFLGAITVSRGRAMQPPAVQTAASSASSRSHSRGRNTTDDEARAVSSVATK